MCGQPVGVCPPCNQQKIQQDEKSPAGRLVVLLGCRQHDMYRECASPEAPLYALDSYKAETPPWVKGGSM
jgi:hypothetical protein